MKKKHLLLLLTNVFFCNFLFAQTWDGSTNTDWNTASNWSTNAVPTSASTVTIPNTTNKPVLANNVTVVGISMAAGSALNFNGFTLTVNGSFNISGATLNNSNAGTDIVIDITNSGSSYFGSNTINDNISINLNGSGIFYEGYQGSDVFNGNTTFNFAGSGAANICYNQPSSFNGNLTVVRAGAGATNVLTQGFNALTGNFSYTNTAGGATSINGGNKASATIGGTVNITATGSGNPAFEMQKIKNLTTGGTISVQNSGQVTIDDDTLTVSALNINGFTGSGADEFRRNSITGNVTFSDDASNTGTTYIGGSIITGNTTFTSNNAGAWYEGYQGADTYNGNIIFNITGTGAITICYNQACSFNGNVTVNRTGIGATNILTQGFNALTGNFNYTNTAGGATSINGGNKASAAIGGIVNITATGSGNPAFEMQKIKNLTTGGTISVQNSGLVTIDDDTLTISALNVAGFTGSGGDEFRRNSITGNVTFSDDAANTGSTYIGGNIITGNTTFTSNTAGIWYEGYQGADTYNGNTIFNITGTGAVNMCYNQACSFTGNLTINRTGIGATNILDQGFTALSGNFSYTNTAGGATSINGGNKASASISGTVNITATGSGNPAFEMRKIKNLTTGGTISVQNSGLVTIDDDTLTVTALNVNGFTGSGGDEFRRNSITGNVTFSDDAANTGSTYIGGTIITGNTTFTSNTAGIWYESYQGSDIYNGNFRFNRVGGTINLAYNDTTSFNGDFILSSATGIVFGSNAFRFGGSSNVIIEQLGAQSIIIPKLFMDKTGTGNVTLKDTVTVTTSLNLTSGIIITGINSNLIIPDGVSYTGGSDASYVDGPMIKTGNDAFVFPVGQNNAFAPVSITAPSATTDQFRAQYIAAVPNDAGYDSTKKDPTINHISKSEYWLLDRVTGTSNVKVTLSWGTPRSGGIDNPSSLAVARWNGTAWKDEGNGTITGDNTEGTVQSLNAVTNFSPFTLASVSALNPLPVTIVNFNAINQQQSISLLWTTENEKNFSHFEIEKKGGNNNFASIATIAANNNAALQQYSFNDETPFIGTSYYRLKLVDIDGNFKYSKVVSVTIINAPSFVIYPNPAKDQVRIIFSGKISSIEISDVSGKLVKRMNSNTGNRYNISDLQKGIYIIKIYDENNGVVSRKLLVE